MPQMPVKMSLSGSASLARLIEAPGFVRAQWAAHLTEKCHGRVGAAPPAIGRMATLDQLERLFAVVERFHSPFAQGWEFEEASIFETEAVYRDSGGQARSTPCVVILRTSRDLVCDLRILLDPGAISDWPFKPE